MAADGTGLDSSNAEASIAHFDRAIAKASNELESLQASRPDSHLVAALEETIAAAKDKRAFAIVAAVFGDVERLDVGATSVSAENPESAVADPPEFARGNIVRDGIPLAHSTLFEDVDAKG